MPSTPPALLLFAHGSRDPAWRVPLDAVRERVAAAHPGPCELAFLEFMQPTLDAALDALAHAGQQRVRVLPLFWASGKHVRADLQAALAAFAQRHPAVQVEVAASLGESPAMQEAIAHWATRDAADPYGLKS